MPALVPPERRALVARLTAQTVAGGLFAFYALLPLDIGFPPLWIGGHPLSSAIVATVTALAVLAVQSRGAALAFLGEPYCLAQSLFCGFLVVVGFASPSPPSALHAALVFFCTFVLNYVIFRHVTREHGVAWLSPVVVGIGLVAAFVGIARGPLGLPLPIYDAWYLAQYNFDAPDYSAATVRAAGTMNNAILYGLLMVLFLPYITDLKRTWLRVVAFGSVIVAAALSGSRTILVALVYALGAVPVYRGRALRVLIAAAVALALVLVPLTGYLMSSDDARVDFILQRAGIKPEENEAVSAANYNLNLRRDVLIAGFRDLSERSTPMTWIAGRGFNASAAVGERVLHNYTTVDNVYLTELIDYGLLGLALFLAAFASFIVRSRHAAQATLHWYSPLALALAGFSFSWNTYSTFNILTVGSMAVAMWWEEHERPGR